MSCPTDYFKLMLKVVRIWYKLLKRRALLMKRQSTEGEVCLITEAGTGFGRLLALQLAQKRAKLILWSRNPELVVETGGMVRKLGGSVFVDVCDISSKTEIRKAASRVREHVGNVTILVNSADVTYQKKQHILANSKRRTKLRTDAFYPVWTVEEFLPDMLKVNHGHIVTVGNPSDIHLRDGKLDFSTSKTETVAFHQALYLDLQRKIGNNIRTTFASQTNVISGMLTGVEVERLWSNPAPELEACIKATADAILLERPLIVIPRAFFSVRNFISRIAAETQIARDELFGAHLTL